jgi:hypothetical protein
VAQGEDPEFKPQYYKKKKKLAMRHNVKNTGLGIPAFMKLTD